MEEVPRLEMQVGQEGHGDNTLQNLGSQMAAAVEQLKSMGSIVDDTVTTDAQQQCESLLSRFAATMKAAEQAMEQAKKELVHRRIPAKQAPPPDRQPAANVGGASDIPSTPNPDVTNRLRGKQKVQSHLKSFFGNTTTTLSTFGKRQAHEQAVPDNKPAQPAHPHVIAGQLALT